MENNNSKLRAKDRLIVALDYDNLNDAINIVEDLGNSVEIYKVGLEIFLNTNGNIIDYLKLKKENEELRKENAFLKKAAAFFAKEM